ncbi:predicted protein [Histoplasma capsulatum G186AR]|uniref:Uncharacterized protein n=1 Tax=Ajellomyces capsulatus (strain G186AR / H82 / ATCC MYA-2454 / RMSCC 2432) TaxID=447093 RepID=C0NC51_AJECG|nr:uncharacterized protein HCBG_00697 [Histoplasma capsulatum G186AR]EEH11242.1 predicted protein [Histoplasma capsulatum G186AR]
MAGIDLRMVIGQSDVEHTGLQEWYLGSPWTRFSVFLQVILISSAQTMETKRGFPSQGVVRGRHHDRQLTAHLKFEEGHVNIAKGTAQAMRTSGYFVTRVEMQVKKD